MPSRVEKKPVNVLRNGTSGITYQLGAAVIGNHLPECVRVGFPGDISTVCEKFDRR
jgi:hypothetical protein